MLLNRSMQYFIVVCLHKDKSESEILPKRDIWSLCLCTDSSWIVLSLIYPTDCSSEILENKNEEVRKVLRISKRCENYRLSTYFCANWRRSSPWTGPGLSLDWSTRSLPSVCSSTTAEVLLLLSLVRDRRSSLIRIAVESLSWSMSLSWRSCKCKFEDYISRMSRFIFLLLRFFFFFFVNTFYFLGTSRFVIDIYIFKTYLHQFKSKLITAHIPLMQHVQRRIQVAL